MLEKRLVRGKDMEYLKRRLNYAALITPPRMKIPKKYQKYKVQSNKTCTTHVIEFWNKRQLQDLYTSAHEIKRGNIHEK